MQRRESGIPNISCYGFKKNQKSQIGIESSYPMMYSADGIYVPSKNGGTPVTVTRKGKGPYEGYAVRA